MNASATSETEHRRDRTFELLANERRRRAMGVLREESTPCHLETLARRVAARERDVGLHDVTGEERNAVARALHHVHLPMLDAADVVSYDAERNEIVASAVRERLRSVPGADSVVAEED